jgi:hypothetical protein
MTNDATALAKQIIAIRSRRKAYFDNDLFDEEPWDVLLMLFVGHEERRTVDRDEIARMTNTRPEILARWLKVLEAEGVITGGFETPTLTADAHIRMHALLADTPPT